MAALSTDKFKKARRKYTTTVGTGGITSAGTTLPLADVTGLDTDTAVVVVVDAHDTAGNATPGLEEVIVGVVSGSSLVSCVRGKEGTTAQAHTEGAQVTMYFTETHWDDVIGGILTDHNQDGTHKTGIALTSPAITGGTQSSPVVTTPNVVTSVNDANGNEVIRTPATASAVNDLTVANAATGNPVTVAASGDDANVWQVVKGKGTGMVLAQIPIYSTGLTGTSSVGGTVIGTINVPAMPVACKVTLMGWNSASLGAGTPTYTFANAIYGGATNLSAGAPDNTKSAAAGIAESRISSLTTVDSLPANTARAYTWQCSGAVYGCSGLFIAIVTAA